MTNNIKRMLSLGLALMSLFVLVPAQADIPPAISGDFLTPHLPEFNKNLSFPVFQGPGQAYQRAGNGKGTVSTNDWIQFFAIDGDYALIQYALGKGRMRLGYIAASFLPAGSWQHHSIYWGDRRLQITSALSLTDDPFGLAGESARIPAGTEVWELRHFGNWVYLDARLPAGRVRGFVDKDAYARALLRDESVPFDIRATSFGHIADDHATMRYYEQSAEAHWQGVDGQKPQIWLRLESRERELDLESLTDFKVVQGDAVCAPMPVKIVGNGDEGMSWAHFFSDGTLRRAALELIVSEGERIQNIVIACTRRVRAEGQPDRDETLTLPLAQVVEDRGSPVGAVRFDATSYVAFSRTRQQMAGAGGVRLVKTPFSLGAILTDLAQPMPSAPDSVLDQPFDTTDYGFYLLEGQTTRPPGAYGVYDVAFELTNPPAGVWIANREECGSCEEMDRFDIFGGERRILRGDLVDGFDYKGTRDNKKQGFWRILLLVDKNGRDEAAIDRLIRGLDITVSFSAEKWDIMFEQHGLASAIGPRSTERMNLSRLTRTEGVRYSLDKEED